MTWEEFHELFMGKFSQHLLGMQKLGVSRTETRDDDSAEKSG